MKLHITAEITERGNLEKLHSYRFSDGLLFPPSYIEFAEQYGYGRVCRNLFIYIPMDNYCDSVFTQSESIKRTYADVLNDENDLWFDLSPDMDYHRLKTLFPFAKSENAHYLFWDTSIRQGSEFDIYISDFRSGFFKAVGDLDGFFDKYCGEAVFEPLKRV